MNFKNTHYHETGQICQKLPDCMSYVQEVRSEWAKRRATIADREFRRLSRPKKLRSPRCAEGMDHCDQLEFGIPDEEY